MPPDKKDMTTIWVSKDVKEKLKSMSRKKETYNNCIDRLLRQEGMVWFDLLSVDGEQPFGHEIIFRLGTVTYRCKDGIPEETDVAIVPAAPKNSSVAETLRRRHGVAEKTKNSH